MQPWLAQYPVMGHTGLGLVHVLQMAHKVESQYVLHAGLIWGTCWIWANMGVEEFDDPVAYDGILVNFLYNFFNYVLLHSFIAQHIA